MQQDCTSTAEPAQNYDFDDNEQHADVSMRACLEQLSRPGKGPMTREQLRVKIRKIVADAGQMYPDDQGLKWGSVASDLERLCYQLQAECEQR